MTSGPPSALSYPSPPSNAVYIPPPLPEIQSEQIRNRVFTHSSTLAKGHKHGFQAPEDDFPLDNEELGHIGDQVVAWAITDLIQELYPYLRVGPASKVRDRIKHRDMLAKICVLYGLHMRLNLGRQASDLRAAQNVQVNVFKAYVGGVYRDQGAEVVSKWLFSLLRPYVEGAYRIVRREHLLPETEAHQLEAPTANTPPPLPSTSLEDARPALQSYLPGEPRDHRRLTSPHADVPQHNLVQAGDGVDTRRAVTDKRRNRRRRRRSSSGDSGSGNGDGALSQHRSSTGLGSTETARKRARAEGTNDG